MGSKADRLNLSETTSNALGSTGGGQPKPIRKRGYHRALKRSELWALQQQNYDSLVSQLEKMYYQPMLDSILKSNEFIGLSQWLPSTPYKVEVEPGNYFGLDRTTVPIRFQTPPKISVWSRIKWLFSF